MTRRTKKVECQGTLEMRQACSEDSQPAVRADIKARQGTGTWHRYRVLQKMQIAFNLVPVKTQKKWWEFERPEGEGTFKTEFPERTDELDTAGRQPLGPGMQRSQ